MEITDAELVKLPWAESHGATIDPVHLGAGHGYSGMVKTLQAQTCVCLGSGGAFVPLVLRRAQLQLVEAGILQQATTYLIDGNTGGWGRPVWWGDPNIAAVGITVLPMLTKDGAEELKKRNTVIDYLHVDADHSYAGALADLLDYSPLVRPDGLIVAHDTSELAQGVRVVPKDGENPEGLGVLAAVYRFMELQPGWSFVNFGCASAPCGAGGFGILRRVKPWRT